MSKIGEECAVELFDKDLRPEIEVGDEVKNGSGIGVITAIRTGEDGKQIYSVMSADGVQLPDAAAEEWELTGRHFPAVTQVLQHIGRFG